MFTIGQSNYQGMQATFNKRFSSGFTLTAGYTLSKELDNLLAARAEPIRLFAREIARARTIGTFSQ